MKIASYWLPGTDTEFWGHSVIANTNCWDYEKSTHTPTWSTCMDTESLCPHTHKHDYGRHVSLCPVWPMPSTLSLNIHTHTPMDTRHTPIGPELQ